MTGPTREEVERFSPLRSFGQMLECTDGDYVRHDDFAALRERLEAAEEDADLQKTAASVWQQASLKNQAALTEATAVLTAVKDAEWNAAIEAAAGKLAANSEAIAEKYGAVLLRTYAAAIRALRRNPKEGV